MNSIKFDVIIVGAGPAGIACGIELQKKGIKNCIIDRAIFPREKLCGGLITEKTFNIINELCDFQSKVFSDSIIENITKVSMWKQNTLAAITNTNTVLRIAERAKLDNSLKKYYEKLGGKVFENEPISQVFFEEKKILSRNYSFEYDFLVAADGAKSQIRKAARLSIPNIGFCLETSVPKSDLDTNGEIQIRFNVLDNGYAWVFPCGEVYKIGFGNKYCSSIDYVTKFKHYLKSIGVKNFESCNIKGAFVPYGGCLKKSTYKDYVFFVGDAAGMVDPIYGEGLFFSYKSGVMVSDCIVNHINGLDIAGLQYEKLRKQDVLEIRQGNILKNVFFTKIVQSLFLNKLKGHENFLRYYIDSQVSYYKYSYKYVWKLVFDYKKQKNGD